MELVEARTLGDGWLEVARRIVEHGGGASWGGAPTREVRDADLRRRAHGPPCVLASHSPITPGSTNLIV